MKNDLRLFLAIPLSVDIRQPIAALQERAKSQLSGWRVVPAENWHVTVHFLGDVSLTKAPAVEKWLRSLAVPKLPALSWNSWIAFPTTAEATTVGLTAPTAPAWKSWIGKLGDELTGMGVVTERRAFIPHLTLFRRSQAGPTQLPTLLPDFAFRPQLLCLFESQRTPSGSRYTARVEKALT